MNLKVPLLLLVFSIHFFSCTRKNQVESEFTETELGNGLTPSEQYFLQRQYPEFTFDAKGYASALQILKQTVTRNIESGFSQLWQLEGPNNIGGRFNTLTIHPSNSNIMYAACATGGIFKTTNDGASWFPIFDDQPFLSIGAIAIDPQNPEIIYAGTGDPNISGYPFIGDGIYKSLNGGLTWFNIGLSQQRIISKIIIHPSNSNIIYASTMGLPFEPNNDRGLYKTTDGGNTWEQILFLSDQAGVIDLLMDHENPEVLYAAGWNRLRNNQVSIITGTESGIYKSTNGGATWDMLSNGLPQGAFCRPSITMSGINSDILYATYSDSTAELFGVYKTTDAGNSWTQLNTTGLDNPFNGQGWFSGGIKLDPANDNDLWLCGVDLWRSNDGGLTWYLGAPEWWQYIVHADHHDVIFRDNAIYTCTDGGIYKTTDNGANWSDIELIPNNQFYRIAIHPHQQGIYAGGVQDNGTTSGNSFSINNWVRLFGGDGFQPVYDSNDPNHYFYEVQNGVIYETFDDGGSFDEITAQLNPDDRRNWDMPYFMSRFNSDLYLGTDKVYRYQSFSMQQLSDDITDGNIYGARFHTISAVRESNTQQGVLFAGTSDANVWRSLNDGVSWENITGSLPERYVSSFATSHITPGLVYVAHTGFKSNDFTPHLHKSLNNGTSWTPIASNLPNFSINDIATYPDNDSILFVATDVGVYATINSGAEWYRLGTNMPYVHAFDIEIDTSKKRLIAGTYGRSIMSYPLDSLIRKPVIYNAIQQLAFKQAGAFPNPYNSQITIQCGSANPCEISIRATDGRMMLFTSNVMQSLKVYTADWVNGIYYVMVRDTITQKSDVFKIIKQ